MQAIGNVFDNARRYAGGVTAVTVTVPRPGWVRIEFEDRGPGIEEEEREAIFGRFARGSAGTNAGSSSGTGLGLALTAEHVRVHGGKIWAEQAASGGARFVLELPVGESVSRWAVLGVVVALAAGGCAVPAQPDAQRAKDGDVPFSLLDPDAPLMVPEPPGPSSERVALCFLRDGRLSVVDKELTSPVSERALLDALAAPPPDAGPLVRTALSDPAIVRDVRLLGGISRVDVAAGVSALPADEQLLAVAQIVCTLTGRPGVGQVSFTLDGAPLAVPKGDGSLVTSPVARDDYASLMG